MPISDQLLDQISTAIGPSTTLSLTTASALSDLFEAYAFSILIQAATVEGAHIEYRDPQDQTTNDFVFRTSPGHIWSTTHPYTFAVIAFPNVEPLEAHLGVMVQGKSTVLHEFDVCLIRRSEALTARRDQVHPRHQKVIAGIECKYYTTSLSLGLARSFIGLGTDVTAKNMFFVTNTSSSSVERLLTARGRRWANRIQPGSAVDIDRLRSDFQIVFQYYRAS